MSSKVQHNKGKIRDNALKALVKSDLFRHKVERKRKGKGSYNRQEAKKWRVLILSRHFYVLNVEALATAARVFDIRVFKFETFLQAFFGVIDLRAVQINQTFRVDIDAGAVFFEYQIFGAGLIDKFKVVCHARAAAGFHTQAYTQAFAALGQVVVDVFGCIFCDGNQNICPFYID